MCQSRATGLANCSLSAVMLAVLACLTHWCFSCQDPTKSCKQDAVHRKLSLLTAEIKAQRQLHFLRANASRRPRNRTSDWASRGRQRASIAGTSNVRNYTYAYCGPDAWYVVCMVCMVCGMWYVPHGMWYGMWYGMYGMLCTCMYMVCTWYGMYHGMYGMWYVCGMVYMVCLCCWVTACWWFEWGQ